MGSLIPQGVKTGFYARVRKTAVFTPSEISQISKPCISGMTSTLGRKREIFEPEVTYFRHVSGNLKCRFRNSRVHSEVAKRQSHNNLLVHTCIYLLYTHIYAVQDRIPRVWHNGAQLPVQTLNARNPIPARMFV